eukprot:1159720-Pelagomonas_calceolata.AAC.6
MEGSGLISGLFAELFGVQEALMACIAAREHARVALAAVFPTLHLPSMSNPSSPVSHERTRTIDRHLES